MKKINDILYKDISDEDKNRWEHIENEIQELIESERYNDIKDISNQMKTISKNLLELIKEIALNYMR